MNKKIADSQVVFITKEGKKYHTDINCRGLTRRVITLDISQVETKKACSKCGATEEDVKHSVSCSYVNFNSV